MIEYTEKEKQAAEEFVKECPKFQYLVEYLYDFKESISKEKVKNTNIIYEINEI